MITDTIILQPLAADMPVGWATMTLAFVTFLLAIINGGLAFQNWRVVREMREDRKASERPALYLWSVPVSADDVFYEEVVLNIQNGGKGPVVEAKVECWMKKKTGDYAYFLYDSAASFASGEARQVGCHASSGALGSPHEGDLVVRLHWRGAKPWWNEW